MKTSAAMMRKTVRQMPMETLELSAPNVVAKNASVRIIRMNKRKMIKKKEPIFFKAHLRRTTM
jgi:hypothetical protein